MNNILTKPIKIKTEKYPTKRRVNLAKRENNTQNLVMLIIGIALIAVLCFLVTKIGVIDQFARLREAEGEYNKVHNQHVELDKAIEDYPNVEHEYHTYSRKWMTGENGIAVSVDRLKVLDLLEARLMSCGTVNSFVVDDDVVIAKMSGMNLEEISAMFAELQRQPIVKNAVLTIASTARDADEKLDFSITVKLQPEEEEK